MTDIGEDRYQEYKDDLAQGYINEDGSPREPEPPDDPPPLDLDQVAGHYHQALGEDLTSVPEHAQEALAAVPELLARLRAAEEELAEWRGREQRCEYGVTRPGEEPPPIVQVGHREVEQAWARPELGTPWIRVITTSPWHRHEASPF